MSERKNSYRGPLITLGLAATLLVGLALPYYVGSPTPTATAMSLRSAAAGYVADVQVGVGQTVAKGDVLIRLSDTELRAQIAQAQHELDTLLASSKTAVAEPILGGIGSVPRVVMVPVKQDALPRAPISPAPTAPVVNPQLAATKKQIASNQAEIAKATAEAPALQSQLDEAKNFVTATDAALKAAQDAQVTAQKESDRMQRLFDMGAVAKRRSDAAKATLDAANTEVSSQQDKLNQAQVHVSDLEKQIKDAAARLDSLKAKLDELNAKIAQIDTKPATPAPAAKPVQEAPKFVKKIVMSSAPIGSTAPVSVTLVDSKDPALQKKIDEATARLEALKAQLADLEIKAPFTGKIVRVLVKPGDPVIAAGVVVKVEAL